MILVFGGTTEGKIVARFLELAKKEYFYSTKRNIDMKSYSYMKHISGGMNKVELIRFCKSESINLIINASHPFAIILHTMIDEVSVSYDIPVIRYSRIFPKIPSNAKCFDTYDEIIDYLISNKKYPLLSFTGLNTINKLERYWKQYDCWIRILNTEESITCAAKTNFPKDRLLYFSSENADEENLILKTKAKVILTKESGDSGYFERKIKAADSLGAEVLIIRKPKLSESFIYVDSLESLKTEIKRILPDYLPLLTGYTTGTCASGALKASLLALYEQKLQKYSEINLPNGEYAEFKILSSSFSSSSSHSSICKFSGDDPDVTNGAIINVNLEFNNLKTIRFIRGEGVGIVSLEGLDIPIGEPAINKMPRQMMLKLVDEIQEKYHDSRGLDIKISVENGEELAKKTLNSKLGILGGISIIGTTGIIKPFSKDAFISSIRKEIKIAYVNNCTHIVINSGAKSEKYLRDRFDSLSPLAFIQYGNFIGETLEIINEYNIQKVSIGIMLGKAVKLAEGHLDTHSKKVLMNKDFIAKIALDCNYSSETISSIRELNLARNITNIIPFNEKEDFYCLLAKKCYHVCKTVLKIDKLEVLLIDNLGNILVSFND
ncbi:precorrin-6x reductase [Marinilabiliaceae bacterium JC040]|nr:precorrin-6x reductase [Marinilabiliaceae bacterium JC040]